MIMNGYKWKEEKPSWNDLLKWYNSNFPDNTLDINNIQKVYFHDDEPAVTIYTNELSIEIRHLYFERPEWFDEGNFDIPDNKSPYQCICIGNNTHIDYHNDSYDHDVFEPLFAELIHDLHLNPDDENLTNALQKFYDNFSNNYKIYDNDEIF